MTETTTEYRGLHGAPGREFEASLDDPRAAFGGDDIYGPNALRYFGSGGPGPNMDAETRRYAVRMLDAHREALAAVLAARGKPYSLVIVYRAVPLDVKGWIQPGDWVTPSRLYAELHGESNVGDPLEEPSFQVWQIAARAGDLFTAGDLCEWGWDPPREPLCPFCGDRHDGGCNGRG